MTDENIFEVTEKKKRHKNSLPDPEIPSGRGPGARLAVKLFITLCAVFLVVFAAWKLSNLKPREIKPEPEPEIVTVATLKKLINVSELATFKAVYNGVAKVYSKTDPSEIDYYVSYEATVDAGMDFEDVSIRVDNEAKEVLVIMPEVHISDINVDIASLDYIFVNDKANTPSVSSDAFKACEQDVRDESGVQPEIIDLAKQNAENSLTALIKPIIEQLDDEYTLVVK